MNREPCAGVGATLLAELMSFESGKVNSGVGVNTVSRSLKRGYIFLGFMFSFLTSQAHLFPLPCGPWGGATDIGWNTFSTSLQVPLVPQVSSVSEELV